MSETLNALYGPGVNSTNRLDVLLRFVHRQRASTFWPAFIAGWPCCDATWWHRRDLLIYLRRHHAADPGPGYLQGDDRAFFDALPDLVEVYRGCSRQRIRGVSWTTDCDVAARFALGHRGIRVPDPVIASAVIPKAHVFAVSVERREAEIILDPRRLRGLAATLS